MGKRALLASSPIAMQRLFQTVLLLALLVGQAAAQDARPTEPHTEVSLGLSFPEMLSGIELKRSELLRQSGQSYYADADGKRSRVGPFGSQIGWNVRTAHYRPIRSIPGLFLGAAATSAWTGTQPANGGVDEAYYLRYLQAGLASKYFVSSRIPVYVGVDAGVTAVWSRNHYLNAERHQSVFRQQGFGTGGRASAGYLLWISQAEHVGLDIKLAAQLNSTRVNNPVAGRDTWRFASYDVSIGILL